MSDLVFKPVKAVRLENLTEEQRTQIAKKITGDFTDWKNQRYGIELIWQSIDRQVNQYDPIYTPQQQAETGLRAKTRYGFGSKLKFPHALAHREGLTSSFMKYLMEDDYDFFSVVPLDETDVDGTEALKQYLMYLLDSMDFQGSLAPFVRDAAQYGTAFASFEWQRITQPQWSRQELRDPLTNMVLDTVDIEEQVTVLDSPVFTPLNIYHVVTDPAGNNPLTDTLIMAKAMSPFEIRANQNYPQWLRDDWDMINGAGVFQVDPNNNATEARERARGDSTFTTSTTYKEKKKVYEAWGNFTDGTNLYVNYVAEVFEEKLIRFEPNPYRMPFKPFLVCSPLRETGRIYGPSLLYPIRGLQAAFDTISNQYVDLWDIEANAPTLVQANSIVQSARHRQGEVHVPPVAKDALWLVRDIATSVGKMPTNRAAQSMNPAPLLDLFARSMETGTGDSALNSGGAAPEYMKTGVAMTIANAGTDKLNMYSKALERGVIIPVLEMMVRYIRQNVQEPQTVKRLDTGQPLSFNPQMLTGEVKFTMRGASYNMTKQQQTNNVMMVLEKVCNSPMFAPFLNPPKIIVQVLKMVGWKNAYEVLNPQAIMMAEQSPPPPSFADKVMSIFQRKQVKEETGANEFSGFLPGVSDASGGTSPTFGKSPFNLVQ